MPSNDHDLPVTSYVLLALLAIGQEAVGLQMALLLGLGLVATWIALTLIDAWRTSCEKHGPRHRPPLNEWGGGGKLSLIHGYRPRRS